MQQAFTVEEIATRLGMSAQTAWIALWKGQLPYRRLGDTVIILGEELDTFLKALPGRSPQEALQRLLTPEEDPKCAYFES